MTFHNSSVSFSSTFHIKPLLAKALHKTLSSRKSTPLPSAQPSNITSTSSRGRNGCLIFSAINETDYVFCWTGLSLASGLIQECLCSIFMQSTLMKQPLIIRWLLLLYIKVSCYQLIYALLIQTRYPRLYAYLLAARVINSCPRLQRLIRGKRSVQCGKTFVYDSLFTPTAREYCGTTILVHPVYNILIYSALVLKYRNVQAKVTQRRCIYYKHV